MKKRVALLFFAFLFAAGDRTAQAQTPPTPPPQRLEKIHDDLYVIMGEGSNTTVYLTDEGVVLVDSKFDRNYAEMVAIVKTLTDKPIRYVINTHAHGDHVGSNQMLSTAQMVGHANARAALIKSKLTTAPPQITYTDQMTLFLGGKEIVLYHFDRCHTDGDTMIYFPARKVLATGDCFNTGNGRGLNPTGSTTAGFYVDYTTGGSLRSWPKVADAALKLDWDAVVPGHGPLTNRAGFLKWQAAVGTLTTRVTAMVREGKPVADVREMLVKEFGWEAMSASIRSVDGMVEELKR